MKAFTNTALAALFVATLAGCGAPGVTTATQAQMTDFDAASAKGLRTAYSRIHKAIFTTMDKDGNGWLDENEAVKHMSLRDFAKADKAKGWGSANKLSRNEFVAYATKGFIFHDTPDDFANRFRKDLGKLFDRLDENNDKLLAKGEISSRDVSRLRLRFDYPKLKVSVPIKKLAAADGDKNGDGNISQAEFEDLYLETVIAALGGEGGAQPPAPPADAPPADVPADVPPAPPAF